MLHCRDGTKLGQFIEDIPLLDQRSELLYQKECLEGPCCVHEFHLLGLDPLPCVTHKCKKLDMNLTKHIKTKTQLYLLLYELVLKLEWFSYSPRHLLKGLLCYRFGPGWRDCWQFGLHLLMEDPVHQGQFSILISHLLDISPCYLNVPFNG